MRPIRSFALINAVGDRYDLNGADGIYASDPTGLGLSLSPVMGDVGRGFFAILSDESEPQLPCGFTVTFTDRANAYDQYFALARWLAAAGDALLLAYAPTPETEYLRSVSVTRISKSEKDQVGWLPVGVELRPRTPWYLPTPLDVPVEDQSDKLLRFPWRMDRARYDLTDRSRFSAELPPGGDVPAAIRFVYSGSAVADPELTLTGLLTGTVYGRCVIHTSLAADETLDYFSGYLTGHVRKITATGAVVDLTDALDPANDNYMRLPVAEPASLAFAVNGQPGRATAEVDYFFRTV